MFEQYFDSVTVALHGCRMKRRVAKDADGFHIQRFDIHKLDHTRQVAEHLLKLFIHNVS